MLEERDIEDHLGAQRVEAARREVHRIVKVRILLDRAGIRGLSLLGGLTG